MKKSFLFKRTVAACAAAAVAASSMSGCTSATQYPMSAGGNDVNPGIYINYVVGEMGNKMYELYYAGEIAEADDCFSKEIDGVTFTEAVKNDALKSTKEFIAINTKFDEFGLTLSDDDWAEIDASVDSAWSTNGDMLEYLGVSKESYKQVTAVNYKRQAIFDYYYAEGGIEEVTDEQVQSYVNENFIRYKMITSPKDLGGDDEETMKQKNKETEERFQRYLEEAEGLSFEEFDRIIDENNAYLDQLEAEANGEELELEDETDEEPELEEDSAAEDSLSEDGEDSGEQDDESSQDSEDADAESDSDEDESTSDDESAEDTDEESEELEEPEEPEEEPTEEESEEEKVPFANESILDATKATDPTSDTYNENYAKMIAAFKEQPYNKAAFYADNENYYVLYITEDISERTDYTEDNKETLVQSMKSDDFDTLVTDWAAALDIKVNNKAIKKYGVKTLYDRQNEYGKKHGAE